ncbi:MAG: site-2 protease family protein [Thermoleophilaceae bacterium]|nr:site-2 protease family protein [Thermoleophilaceae bacterium]
MSWLLAFLGFVVLIVLHEAGHFAAAKAVGMRVERFSLFFPPLLARKRVGETEYAIGALPLGGYVKISGMNPDERLPEEVRDRAYHAQPPWKRIVVIAAGPAVNVVIAFVLLFLYFWQIGAQDISNRVAGVDRSLPAAGVLQPGDRIVGVDGRRLAPAAISSAIAAHGCPGGRRVDGCAAATPVRLTVERDGARRTVSLTPRYDSATKRMRVGFLLGTGGQRQTLAAGESFTWTADRFWYLTKQTVALPARIFDERKRKDISSVVGGYEATRQTIERDAADAVTLIAVISLSLAIVNLFPFLPLDGGHIFWALVEKVRRRPVPFRVMEQASVVGFMLIIGLFVIGLTNDLDRLRSGGFNVR